MIKRIVLIFLVLIMAGRAGAKSYNDYDINSGPLSTDVLMGLDNPGGSWALQRFVISDLFTLGDTLDHTWTGTIDASGVTAWTSGPQVWSLVSTLPTARDGMIFYYDGGTWPVFGFYDGTTPEYLANFDTFPTVDGYALLYDSASGKLVWGPAGDVTANSVTDFTNKSFNANATGNSITNIEVADFAGSSVETSSEGLTDTDGAVPTSATVKAYADSLVSGAPIYQATDPTIADITGWYFNTTDWELFRNEYGIRTVNVHAATLDDSDTTDPVNADGGTDSTHDGATNITLDVDVTEQYISTVTYSSTELSLTDVVMSQSGSAPNYTYTASVDPNGSTNTIDLVVTSTDLTGNTDSDTYNVTYSGGASYTLEESYGQTINTDMGIGYTTDYEIRGSRFVAAATYTCTRADVRWRSVGTGVTANVTLYLYSSSTGNASEMVLLATSTNTISGSSIGSSYQTDTFTFRGASITTGDYIFYVAGTPYGTGGDSTNYIGWGEDNINATTEVRQTASTPAFVEVTTSGDNQWIQLFSGGE